MREKKIFRILLGENTMKQYEAVIEVMEEKGGYATLGELYKEVLNL